jgi:ribonuclease D
MRVTLVRTDAEVAHLATRVLARVEAGFARVALDTESNGMFVFRGRLCVLQLAFEAHDGLEVALVDTLSADVRALAPVLCDERVTKVLHDLAFDARILASEGLPLRGVRDTSILARFLGAEATGLAAVAARELGVSLSKALQRHDWARRPLEPPHLEYLTGDVAHLLAIDDALTARARELDVEPEIATETAFRLAQSIEPDVRPAWTRAPGVSLLSGRARAALRALWDEREALAAELDRPSGPLVPAAALVQLAREAPSSASGVARLVPDGRLRRHAARLHAALRRGLGQGDVPADEAAWLAAPSPEMVKRRRSAERALQGWRTKEARARGVDEQVVLPGHRLGEWSATPTASPSS